MSTEFEQIEGEEGEEFEEFEDVPEVAAEVTAPAKRGRKPKAEGEAKPAKVAKEVKPVTLKEIEAETLLYPPDMFAVTLNSIGHKDYAFEDPATALSWVTRRIYNEENVSDQVLTLHGLLGSIRHLTTVDRRLGDILEALGNSPDFTKNQVWNSLQRLGSRLNDALVSVPDVSATSAIRTPALQVVEFIQGLKDVPTEDSKQVVREASQETDAEGNVTEIPAEVKTTSTANERNTLAEELRAKVTAIRSTKIYLNQHLSPDA
jgi:hypothetical protein